MAGNDKCTLCRKNESEHPNGLCNECWLDWCFPEDED